MGLLYPKCEFALSPAVTEETSLEISSGLKHKITKKDTVKCHSLEENFFFFFLSQSQVLKSGNSKVAFSHMVEFFFFLIF